jgi:hypothetical protein
MRHHHSTDLQCRVVYTHYYILLLTVHSSHSRMHHFNQKIASIIIPHKDMMCETYVCFICLILLMRKIVSCAGNVSDRSLTLSLFTRKLRALFLLSLSRAHINILNCIDIAN